MVTTNANYLVYITATECAISHVVIIYYNNNKLAVFKERIHTIFDFIKVFYGNKLILPSFLSKEQKEIINSHFDF